MRRRWRKWFPTAIVHCHLRTLDRLGIDYDLLTQESEILRLKFWDAAFAMLKERGAVELATSGKNTGCWIMELPADRAAKAASEAGTEGAEAPVEENPEEADAKMIVRSTGTVTYVGKDIALHLWKFGLLERDFHYRHFHKHPDGHEAWVTSSERGRSGRAAFRPRAGTFQCDRFAAGVSAESGGGGAAGLGLQRRSRSAEAFRVQRGGADAALRDRDGLRNSGRGCEAAVHRSERAQRPGRQSGRSAGPNGSQRAAGSGDAAAGHNRSGTARPSRMRWRLGRCGIFCCDSRDRP